MRVYVVGRVERFTGELPSWMEQPQHINAEAVEKKLQELESLGYSIVATYVADGYLYAVCRV